MLPDNNQNLVYSLNLLLGHEVSVLLGHELEEGDNPDTRAQALSERREGRGEATVLGYTGCWAELSGPRGMKKRGGPRGVKTGSSTLAGQKQEGREKTFLFSFYNFQSNFELDFEFLLNFESIHSAQK